MSTPTARTTISAPTAHQYQAGHRGPVDDLLLCLPDLASAHAASSGMRFLVA